MRTSFIVQHGNRGQVLTYYRRFHSVIIKASRQPNTLKEMTCCVSLKFRKTSSLKCQQFFFFQLNSNESTKNALYFLVNCSINFEEGLTTHFQSVIAKLYHLILPFILAISKTNTLQVAFWCKNVNPRESFIDIATSARPKCTVASGGRKC